MTNWLPDVPIEWYTMISKSCYVPGEEDMRTAKTTYEKAQEQLAMKKKGSRAGGRGMIKKSGGAG